MLFSDLISQLPSIDRNAKINLGPDPWIEGAAPNRKAQQGEISFYENNKTASLHTQTAPSALILPLNAAIQDSASNAGIAWVESSNPKLIFAECLEILHPEESIVSGIDSSAKIHPSAIIEDEVFVGPLAVIGPGCHISFGVRIHAGVVLHQQVEIGVQTEICSGVVIHRRTSVGKNCLIKANAVLGAEGFGFVHTERGLRKMPQTGRVILEDDVEIGCNSCVDRPAMGETRIGRGTKIDNLVQIGHGVQIGSNCALASQVGIAGAAELGHGVILGGQVGVADKIKLGDGVIAYAKTAIPGNVPAGESVCGIPAMPAKLFARSSAVFKSLPEMARNLRRLQKDLTVTSD